MNEIFLEELEKLFNHADRNKYYNPSNERAVDDEAFYYLINASYLDNVRKALQKINKK